jgi:hypothetical protein
LHKSIALLILESKAFVVDCTNPVNSAYEPETSSQLLQRFTLYTFANNGYRKRIYASLHQEIASLKKQTDTFSVDELSSIQAFNRGIHFVRAYSPIGVR